MTIGKRIKRLRTDMGMSQVEFASAIGVSKQTLYKYENDIITNIPSDKIEAMAELTQKSPAYLMGWTEPNILIMLDNKEKMLIETYRKLPDDSKAKLSTYAAMLSNIYMLEEPILNAANTRTDISLPDGTDTSDDNIMDDDDF